jgi:hypothetical protein
MHLSMVKTSEKDAGSHRYVTVLFLGRLSLLISETLSLLLLLPGSLLEEGMSWGPSSAAAAADPLQGGVPRHRYRNRAASSMLFLRGAGSGRHGSPGR